MPAQRAWSKRSVASTVEVPLPTNPPPCTCICPGRSPPVAVDDSLGAYTHTCACLMLPAVDTRTAFARLRAGWRVVESCHRGARSRRALLPRDARAVRVRLLIADTPFEINKVFADTHTHMSVQSAGSALYPQCSRTTNSCAERSRRWRCVRVCEYIYIYIYTHTYSHTHTHTHTQCIATRMLESVCGIRLRRQSEYYVCARLRASDMSGRAALRARSRACRPSWTVRGDARSSRGVVARGQARLVDSKGWVCSVKRWVN